jgi:hypothetical protein
MSDTLALLEQAIKDAHETAKENAERHTVKRDRMIVHFTEKALALLQPAVADAKEEGARAERQQAIRCLQHDIEECEKRGEVDAANALKLACDYVARLGDAMEEARREAQKGVRS